MYALEQKYRGYLKQDGHSVEQAADDEAGDLQFSIKFEGHTYWFFFSKREPDYVVLAVTDFFPLKTEADQFNALLAMEFVASNSDCAKIHFTSERDDVICRVEFLDNGSSVDASMLLRYLRMARSGVNEFRKKMDELQHDD